MDKIKIVSASPTQSAYEYQGEDGIYSALSDFFIVAETERGEVYALEGFATDDEERALRFAKKVEARGEINLDHWVFYRTVYGSVACEDEQAEASLYARSLAAGIGSIDDVPGHLQALL